jgi:hypothetical protein
MNKGAVSVQLTCPNCNEAGGGLYCSYCGEKITADRITLPYILNQWVDIYLGIETGLPATIWQMLVSPGKFIHSYFHGKRISYYKPMKFPLLMGSLSIISALLFKDKKSMEIDSSVGFFFDEFYAFANNDISLIINIVIIFQFPIAAGFTWWRNRKKGFTYGEHLYVNALIAGQIFVFQIALNLLNWFAELFSTGINFDPIFALLTMFYFAYVYSLWIHRQIKWPHFFKTTLASGAIYIISFLFAFLVCVILLYLFTIVVLRNNLI